MQSGIFQFPAYLYAMPFAAIGLLLLYTQSRRRRSRRLQMLSMAMSRDEAYGNHDAIRSRIKVTLLTLGLLMLLCALARPMGGVEWREVRQLPSNLLIVLDVSRSMRVGDLYPNRLERAKWLVRELLELDTSSHVGLLVFAGDALLQCPLTEDRGSLLVSLDQQRTEVMSRQGSSLGRVLMMLPELLPDPVRDRVLVVSDGEDHSPRTNAAVHYLRNAGVRVNTLCVGTRKGGLIPNPEGHSEPYFQDEKGKVVFSRANPQRLKLISKELGGVFLHFESEGQSVRELEVFAKPVPAAGSGVTDFRQTFSEWFQWPLLAAFLLLAVDMAMGTRRTRSLGGRQ
jgi:Ca-activated chloride channel family protein